MSNSRYYQFLYTKHGKPVVLDVTVPIGGTGAIGTLVSGSGIKSITRISAGILQVNFLDNYNKFLGMDFAVQSPVSGSNVNDGSFSSGTVYQITAVGTTNWQAIGLPTGITAVVGTVFKATGVGGAGSGTAKVLGVSGLSSIEVMGNPTLTLTATGAGSGSPFLIVQCLAATNSSTTTQIPADAASGSTLFLKFYFSDSNNNTAAGG